MQDHMLRRSVFSNGLIPNRVVTLCEVNEAVDASRTLLLPERIDYFASIGIDYDNVELYGEVVRRLERSRDRRDLNGLCEKLRRVHVAIMFCVHFTMDIKQ